MPVGKAPAGPPGPWSGPGAGCGGLGRLLDGVEAEPARLLGFVREQHRARMVADAHLYAAAAAWADQHSSETITAADWVPGGDTARPVAGLHVEAWQAGRVADATMVLDPAAAAWVDAQVASCVAKVGDTQLGRLIGEAIARFDPVLAEQERTAQDQVATWCGTDTRVTLTPVIDTTDCIAVDAYEVPDRRPVTTPPHTPPPAPR